MSEYLEEQEPKIKTGYKTTEFWLSLAAVLLGAVVASGFIPETGPVAQAIGLASTVLASLGYSVSRALVKIQGK